MSSFVDGQRLRADNLNGAFTTVQESASGAYLFQQSASGSVSLTTQEAIGERVSVTHFGAKTTAADNYAAFMDAANYLASIGGGIIYVPPGVFKIAQQLYMPTGGHVLIRGQGIKASVLNFPNGGGIEFDGDSYCGAEDLGIEAGTGFISTNTYGPGASGAGVTFRNCASAGTGLRRVHVAGFENGVQDLGSWNTEIWSVRISQTKYAALLIDRDRSADPSRIYAWNESWDTARIGGGTDIRNLNINNNGYVSYASVGIGSDNSQSVGMRIRGTGGVVAYGVIPNEMNRGLLVDPPDCAVQYIELHGVAPDTCDGDGFVLDGTVGGLINNVRGNTTWSGYNGGTGYVFKSQAYGDGGSSLRDVELVSPRSRQNIGAGILFQGSGGVRLVSPEVQYNSRGNAGANPGIYSDVGAGNWSLIGGRVGSDTVNMAPGDTGTGDQGDSVFIAAGAGDNITVLGTDLRGYLTGKSAVANGATGTNIQILSCLPASANRSLALGPEYDSDTSAAAAGLPIGTTYFNTTSGAYTKRRA